LTVKEETAPNAAKGNSTLAPSLSQKNSPTNAAEKSPPASQETECCFAWAANKFFGLFAPAKRMDVLLTIFNGILAIATCVLVFWTIQDVKTARDTAKRQLRAYLSITNAVLSGPLYDGGQHVYEVEVTLKNSGQTPAKEVKVDVWLAILPSNPPLDYSFPETPSDPLGAHIMGAGQEVPNYANVKTDMTPERYDNIMHRRGEAFWVYGRVRYEDIFGVAAKGTKFCFFFAWSSNNSRWEATPWGDANKMT
jgi:hypothetical protein